jgi:hypothetical protein
LADRCHWNVRQWDKGGNWWPRLATLGIGQSHRNRPWHTHFVQLTSEAGIATSEFKLPLLVAALCVAVCLAVLALPLEVAVLRKWEREL